MNLVGFSTSNKVKNHCDRHTSSSHKRKFDRHECVRVFHISAASFFSLQICGGAPGGAQPFQGGHVPPLAPHRSATAQDSDLTCYHLMNGTIMPYGPLLASGSVVVLVVVVVVVVWLYWL